MKKYSWLAIAPDGQTQKGQDASYNASILHVKLSQKGFRNIKIKRKLLPKLTRQKKMSQLEIIGFYKSLYYLINSNIPLSDSLTLLESTHRKKSVRTIVSRINETVTAGSSFSAAVSKQPGLTNTFIDSILQNAELSGRFGDGLKNIVENLELEKQLKKKIKKAFTYPFIVLSSTILIFTFMMVFIVPQFEKLFHSYHATLPTTTQTMLKISNYLKDHTISIILFIILKYLLLIFIKKHNKSRVDKLLLRTPIGKAIKIINNARIFRVLSMSSASNIDIIQSLKTAMNITNNAVYQTSFSNIIDSIKEGHSIHYAFKPYSLFSTFDIQMLRIAETTGNLSESFSQIASHYEEEVDNLVTNINTTLEPIIMLILGLFVGGFVLTMYMPIFKLGSVF